MLIANEYVKSSQETTFIIRKIQTKTTMRYYCTSIRRVQIKNRLTKANVGEYIEQLELANIADGKVKCTKTLETVFQFLIMLNTHIYPKEMKIYLISIQKTQT